MSNHLISKIQTWRPDTHPGYVIEEEWEYDTELRRDTGRQHRCVSIRYPDGTYINRDTHGASVQEHYENLCAQHRTKNQVYRLITEWLPVRMKKPMLDSDGDPVLDNTGKPRLVVKDKHRPRWNHLGEGRYRFVVPGIDEATYTELAAKVSQQFGGNAVLLQSAS